MNNIEDLIQKALELQSYGLVTGQIADELNVSRETATWLLTRSKKGETTPAPKDIFVTWNSIGKNAPRLHKVSLALCDMALETLENTNTEVDVVVGVANSGIPLASLMAYELVHRFLINSILDCNSTRHFIPFFHFISPRKKN
jgi:orotate phosphoribosyltransferase